MCFDDFASAFASVGRDSLWRKMEKADGMPPKLLRLIKAFYALAKMKVRQEGVAQCPLSFAPAFAKDVFSNLPSSITYSTGFLSKPYEIT